MYRFENDDVTSLPKGRFISRAAPRRTRRNLVRPGFDCDSPPFYKDKFLSRRTILTHAHNLSFLSLTFHKMADNNRNPVPGFMGDDEVGLVFFGADF